MTRFIKRLSATKDVEKADDIYQLDICKIEEEEKYDGFCALATNVDARPIYHQQQKKRKKPYPDKILCEYGNIFNGKYNFNLDFNAWLNNV